MSAFDFSGKRVLVTGASRGIGLGVARGFAKAGADLAIGCGDHVGKADAAYDLIVETGQKIHPIALSEDGREANPLLLDRIQMEGVDL